MILDDYKIIPYKFQEEKKNSKNAIADNDCFVFLYHKS